MLLPCSSIDYLQRIPFFSVAGGRQNIMSEQSSDIIMSQIKYKDVTLVLRQCDTGLLSSSNHNAPINVQFLQITPFSPLSQQVEITSFPVAVVNLPELHLILESNPCLLKSFKPLN